MSEALSDAAVMISEQEERN